MKVRVAHCALETARIDGPLEETFEVVRETRGRAGALGSRRGPLLRARVECHGGEYVPGAACASCSHFLDAVASPDGNSVAVRCMFLEADPVEAVMTRADQLVVVDERAAVEVARQRARASGANHVVVTSEGEVAGVVSADRLARSSVRAAVGERVTLPVRVVGKTASLAVVARILGDRGLDYLLVVDGDELRGMVTRADLGRANVPRGGDSRPRSGRARVSSIG